MARKRASGNKESTSPNNSPKKKHKIKHEHSERESEGGEEEPCDSSSDSKPEIVPKPISMKFKCPTDFNCITPVVNKGTLKEDLEDDSIELWLCKIPTDMNIKKLNDQVVNLNGSINLRSMEENTYPKCTELIFETAQNKQNVSQPLTVLAMSKADGHLHPVCKDFKGMLTVKEFPIPEPYRLPPIKNKEKKQIPEGLKQRYIPFGSDTPHVSSAKRQKKKKKSKQD